MPEADLPPDPTEGETFTLRARAEDGTVHEIELSAAQALDIAAGRSVGPVRYKGLAVEDDGTIVEHESAVPPEARHPEEDQ